LHFSFYFSKPHWQAAFVTQNKGTHMTPTNPYVRRVLQTHSKLQDYANHPPFEPDAAESDQLLREAARAIDWLVNAKSLVNTRMASADANVIDAAQYLHHKYTQNGSLSEGIVVLREALLAREKVVDAFLVGRYIDELSTRNPQET
jgi:hypothetical protein